MKLSDWKADETLVEVVDGYADGMPPIDKQVSIMGRELLQVCDNDGALAFAGAVQAYVEACAYAAQLKQERDKLAQEIVDGVNNVLRIRCLKHLDVPQLNTSEHSGGECGACIAAERDSLSRRVEALERQVEEMVR